ncbi:MAG: type II toxin-antitoxin system HicA family toxin [Dehalococcoidia bacterium]|nr:type II toxin-antitoxin system HicA family toxin [Dehalococcoidia bacterium]
MKGTKKLVQKFLTDRMHITVEDCDRLLASQGYELRKGGGSHRTYHKKDARPITVVGPKGTKHVKSVYIDLIIKYLKPEA